MNFIADAYSWIKALHIVSVIAWMSGLLYLPRLFVYHASAPAGSPQSETFKIMEAKLSRIIMLPAMIATLILGGMLAGQSGIVLQGWFHVKLLLVVGLLAYHHLLGRWRLAFAGDRNRHSARFYRMINEIPAVLMVAIVALVVVKPF
jgi:protoporphyrinogen IX oxidase